MPIQDLFKKNQVWKMMLIRSSGRAMAPALGAIVAQKRLSDRE
jgi:hypothetical protein